MENITRTVLGAAVQTSQLLGKPIAIMPNSTLNQKFAIQDSVVFSNTDIVSMKYVAIGNGGHRMVVGANNISRPEPMQHSPRDCALYNQLPFVLRLPNEDLSATQRANYRLRKSVTHDGQVYVAYYLKVLDLSESVPQLELRTVEGGVTTSTPYAPTLSDLNPTPTAITTGQVLTTTGDYIAATAKVPFTMTTFDIEELLNVCNIIYGDDNYAIISEIALCSGVDRAVTGDFNGTNAGYTEAIGVQVMNFVNSFFSAKFSNSGVVINLDLGSNEPLMTLS